MTVWLILLLPVPVSLYNISYITVVFAIITSVSVIEVARVAVICFLANTI